MSCSSAVSRSARPDALRGMVAVGRLPYRNPGVSPLQELEYEEYERSDETPMPVTRSVDLGIASSTPTVADPGGLELAQVRDALGFRVGKVAMRTPSKILQSEEGFGMLIDHLDHFLVLLGSSLTAPPNPGNARRSAPSCRQQS